MGLYWFHLSCSPGNTEDSSSLVGGTCSLFPREREQEPPPQLQFSGWERDEKCILLLFGFLRDYGCKSHAQMERMLSFLFYFFYPLHNFLAPISDLEVSFIYLGEGVGWTVAVLFHDFNCSIFFPLIISLLHPLVTAKPINPTINPMAL